MGNRDIIGQPSGAWGHGDGEDAGYRDVGHVGLWRHKVGSGQHRTHQGDTRNRDDVLGFPLHHLGPRLAGKTQRQD